MSHQTSLDSYFKSKSSHFSQENNMDKKKNKRYCLNLTRSPRPNKFAKKLVQHVEDNQVKVEVTTEDDLICLISSDEDLHTPPKKNTPMVPSSKALLCSPQDNVLSVNHYVGSPNTSMSSSSTVEYSISPRDFISTSHIQQSPRTPSISPRSAKKFFSPTKKRLVHDRSPAKRNLNFQFKENARQQNLTQELNEAETPKYQDYKTQFFSTMINDWINNEALKKLLEEDCHMLLANLMNMEESGVKLVCRLYWRKAGWYCADEIKRIASGKSKVFGTDVLKMMPTLLENGWITHSDAEVMKFDDYVKVLKRPDLLQICKDLKLKIQSKQDAVGALRKFSQGKAISHFFTGGVGNNSERVLKILKSKMGLCYKLSNIARSTLDKLYVLMYLGMDYSIIRDKKLEFILLHDKINKETYPIDKCVELDDASVVFQNKNEFYRYLEAHSIYENYITSVDTREKCEMVLKAFKLYKEVTDQDMLRYKSLPPWLRRFTPASIYVKMMENGIEELKKPRTVEQYEAAIQIIECLSTQTTFRQHKRANWFAEKALILHKHLDRSEQAAMSLLEGFKADWSEEAKDTLRPRAKLIANQKNVDLDDCLRQDLRCYAEQQLVLESSLPAEHVYKLPIDNYNQKGKLKFKVDTKDGRAIVSAEDYCVFHYKHNGQFTHGEHTEGRIVTTIFFLLFWDIIYSKPVGISGIFMSYYQRYPLDMYYENFYVNRKTLIDDRLKLIDESSEETIVEMMQMRWEERPEHEVSDILRTVTWESLSSVARCLGARALGAICGRLARNFGYTHSGFPDLTLWNIHTKQIKFVEVKTDADKPSVKQLQWLQYLTSHHIAAGFCYVGANTTRCKARGGDAAC